MKKKKKILMNIIVLAIFGGGIFSFENSQTFFLNEQNSSLIPISAAVPESPIMSNITSPNYNGSVSITWSSVIGTDNYTLYTFDSFINEVNGSLSTMYTGPITSMNWSLPNGTYYFAVIASNESGDSDISNCVEVTVILTEIPLAPNLNPIASPDYDGNVILSWNSVEGANFYIVYRSTSFIEATGGEPMFGNLTGSTSYQDIGLSPGVYYYVITALNNSGASKRSNCENVTVEIPLIEETPQAPVLNIFIPDAADGTFHISWNLVPGADNYTLYRHNSYITEINGSIDYSLTNTINGSIVENSVMVTVSYIFNIKTEGTYYFAVIASNESGDSELSNCESITIITPTLQFPQAPILEISQDIPLVGTNGTFQISWNTVPGADNYTLYRHNSYITEINGSIDYSFTTPFNNIFNLYMADGTYYFAVIASNESGDSELSNCVCVIVNNAINPENTNGIWQEVNAGLYSINCTDENGILYMLGVLEILQEGEIRLSHYNTNPTSTPAIENALFSNYYQIEADESIIKEGSFRMNFYYDEWNFTETEESSLCVYQLINNQWFPLAGEVNIVNNKIQILNVDANGIYAIGINLSDDNSETDSIGAIPGYPLKFVSSFIILGVLFIIKKKRELTKI